MRKSKFTSTLTKIGVIIVVAIVMLIASTQRWITSAGVIASPYEKTNKIEGTVLAVGSTALQVLADYAAEEFQAKHTGVTVTVQGGGSGAGLSQIQAGSVQIGNSDVFAETKSGIDASLLKDHQVAVVGFAPVVNKDVKIDNLTPAQLHDIFIGKITNWKEVGGQDLAITIINRAAGSGSRAVFESAVLKTGEMAVKSQEQDSNGTVRQIVSSTPGTISYLSFGEIYGKGLKSLSLDNVQPTAQNVEENKWTIWSYEHMYTKGKPYGASKAYLEFFLSNDFQTRILPKLGYIPIDGMQYVKNASGDVTAK